MHISLISSSDITMHTRATVLLLAMVSSLSNAEERPTVRIPQGELSGVFTRTRNGRAVEAFTSIPFAQPPLGELRFKAPLEAGGWSGVLDASREGPLCVQRNPYIRQEEIVGQEDCLYLNVYAPADWRRSSPSKGLPVMVFFHGGGWMCGAGTRSFYGPDHLLDRDVVYVGTNYRLGPLGFLSTQDAACPGNNGLKDQQEALRWIQKNIHFFGGDNSSVTLFGESAGGASAHLHMLSPSSAGLFHKAISQSGTGLVPWAQAAPGEPLAQAHQLARLLACPFAPSSALLACLRTKPARHIIDTEFSFYSWDYEPMTPFKAVVEPDLPGAFLARDPRELPDTPSVPWLTGLTKDEGCLKSTWILANKTLMEEFSNGFDTIAPITFYYKNSPDVDGITDRIRHLYFNGKNAGEIDESDKQSLIDVYTDSYFAYGLIEALRVNLQHSKHPTYLYEITYRASNSFSQIFGDTDGNHGVCHADDIMYLFPIPFLAKPWTEKDKEMINVFVTLWTNFATSGDPNKPNHVAEAEWKPVTSLDSMEHFVIGDELKMSTKLAMRSKIWDEFPLWHKYSKQKLRDEL